MVFIARFQYIGKNHPSGYKRIRSILMVLMIFSLKQQKALPPTSIGRSAWPVCARSARTFRDTVCLPALEEHRRFSGPPAAEEVVI